MAKVVNVNNVHVTEDVLMRIQALPFSEGSYLDNSHFLYRDEIILNNEIIATS